MWLSYHDFVAISAAVAAREGKEWGLTYKQWALVKSSLQVMGIIATAGQRGELFCHQTWRTVIHAVEAAPEPFLMIGPDPIPTRVLSCKDYQCKETVITAEKKSILHLKNGA